MSTVTQGDLTIIRHDQTDGIISVYRDEQHIGLIYPALGYNAVPTDAARPGVVCGNEALAIAYLTNTRDAAAE